MYVLQETSFFAKLKALSYLTVTTSDPSALMEATQSVSPPQPMSQSTQFDVVLDITGGGAGCCTDKEGGGCANKAAEGIRWQQLHALLVPGGVCCALSCLAPPDMPQLWGTVHPFPSSTTGLESSEHWYGTLQKAAACCNYTAARYWVESDADTDVSADEDHFQCNSKSCLASIQERALLEAVTITPTVAQRNHLQNQHLQSSASSQPQPSSKSSPSPTSPLPDTAIAQAVQALRDHGVCILRGFFSPQVG